MKLRIRIAIICVLCLQHPGNLAAVEGTDKITTFAGSVDGGFSGDGGPANKAKLSSPEGLFLDEKGVLYIVDAGNGCIRRVGLDGIIETIAGNGDKVFSGDGGPAAEASFNDPTNVAVDSKGNIYIADTNNHRIRVVHPGGIITTFAGSATEYRLVAEPERGLVSGFSGDGGLATEAELYWPGGVAVDRRGNVYIADTFNNRVRKVDAFSGMISTFAGSGPTEVGGARILEGDGGPATEAQVYWPTDIAIDGSDIYIADTGNQRIRRVDATGVITTFAGGRGDLALVRDGILATEAALWFPYGVAVDSKGNVYLADSGNNRIRVVNTSRIIDTLAGSRGGGFGDGGPANQAQLNNPYGVAVDADGINVYFSDSGTIASAAWGPTGSLP